jgi:ABC-2 type transport system permease protein
MNKSSVSIISPFSKVVMGSTREPVTLFWIMAPAVALFSLLSIASQDPNPLLGSNICATSWLYAYLSLSIALFGFALNVVKRQESKITRCFLYTRKSKVLFIGRLYFAYSTLSIGLCLAFYLATECHSGNCQVMGFTSIALRFYLCFTLFCGMGLLLSWLPIAFQSFRELIILATLIMLITGTLADISPSELTDAINFANPLSLARRMMSEDLTLNLTTACFIILFFLSMFAGAVKYSGTGSTQNRYR